MLLHLDQSPRAFKDHFGDQDVILGSFVGARSDDVALLDRSAKVGDLFGALVDQQDDDGDIGVISIHAVRDVFQQRRLSRFGRSDDEAALTFSKR